MTRLTAEHLRNEGKAGQYKVFNAGPTNFSTGHYSNQFISKTENFDDDTTAANFRVVFLGNAAASSHALHKNQALVIDKLIIGTP